MADENLDDWSDYESGPFCRHWSEPSECEEKCMKCGHSCQEHGSIDNEPCTHEGCSCEGWVENL